MKKTLAVAALLLLFFWGLWQHFYQLKPWPEPAERIIQVHIDGSIASPGVYALPHTARLEALIEEAGGLLPQADRLRINLAQRLMDGEKIVILEVPAMEGDGPASSQPTAYLPLDEQSWLAVPGIGPATAARITEYLSAHPAATLDDLIHVSGIGPAKLADIKSYFQP